MGGTKALWVYVVVSVKLIERVNVEGNRCHDVLMFLPHLYLDAADLDV